MPGEGQIFPSVSAWSLPLCKQFCKGIRIYNGCRFPCSVPSAWGTSLTDMACSFWWILQVNLRSQQHSAGADVNGNGHTHAKINKAVTGHRNWNSILCSVNCLNSPWHAFVLSQLTISQMSLGNIMYAKERSQLVCWMNPSCSERWETLIDECSQAMSVGFGVWEYSWACLIY